MIITAATTFKKLITKVILLLTVSATYAQNDTAYLRHTTNAFENWTATNPQEKIYLHLDKTNYDLYDTVWYKAYAVTGAHHQLSAISGVLYVELISPKDSIITRQILPLTAGIAWGDVVLPTQIKPGDYQLRAYTNWMRNAGPEYFYYQKIHIADEQKAASNKQITQANPDVQFMPEGGYLVNGLRSRIAVKAVNANGMGQDVKGTIEDNDGNVLVDFATQHLGMGVFALTPLKGKNYHAKIIAGETRFIVDLPKAKDEGFTLSINNTKPDSIFLRIAVNESTFKAKQQTGFFITAQNSGKIYYSATARLNEQSFGASVDKKRFPTGITLFTLFSANGEPLNERLVFIQNNDTLKIQAGSPVSRYSPRQKVNISMAANKDVDKPAIGTFSVSVTNESLLPVDGMAENTIMNTLLLTSDLSGYVEQPNYYFTNPNEQTRANLDLLMLTQGYQRFEWKKALNDSLPEAIYQPENLLAISGVVKTMSGKPVVNGKVTLMSIKNNLLADTTTAINGSFTFNDIDLPDSAKVVLKAKDAKGRDDVTVAIAPATFPTVIKQPGMVEIADTLKNPQTPLVANNIYREQKAAQLKNRHQLKEVVIKSSKIYKRKELDIANSDNLNGPGQADQVIMGDTLKGCPVLVNCLTRLVKGVQFQSGKAYNTRPYDAPDHTGKPLMDVIVDGMVIHEAHLNDYDANLIQSIEVLRSQSYMAIYGSSISAAGALVITTKRGSNYLKDVKPAPGMLQYTFNGFYKAHEFYSPKYEVAKTNPSTSDLRSTIYWNPNIVTDKDGKATFEYFNADTKGTYRVVIEGIDEDGNLGRVVYQYKVE